MEKLVDELVLKIFKFSDTKDLVAMTRVSQRYREIARDPSLWKKIEIDTGKHSINYTRLLAKQCPESLEDLKFLPLKSFIVSAQQKGDLPSSIMFLEPFCSCNFLRKLTLGALQVDNQVIELISSSFPDIKIVEIMYSSGALTRGLQNLLRENNGLERLYINFIHSTSVEQNERLLTLLSKNFVAGSLKSLHVEIQILEARSNKALIKMLDNHKDKLVGLRIIGPGITDATSSKIAACPKLELLSVSVSDSVTDSSLVHFEKLGNLKHLELIFVDQVTSVGLVNFFNESASSGILNRLILCDMKNLSNDVLYAVAGKCPEVNELDVADCQKLEQPAAESFIPILAGFKGLQSLRLGAGRFSRNKLYQIPVFVQHLKVVSLCKTNFGKHTLAELKRLAPELKVFQESL